MKFKIPNKLTENLYTLLRRCNYTPIKDSKTGKESYIRKPTNERYPRFHLYLTEESDHTIFDLHLDQNKNIYEGAKAHNADYDSEEVKNELARIFWEIEKYLKK